jgi:sigma-B regulation protein RsbU (phosphoserine phosphatase)
MAIDAVHLAALERELQIARQIQSSFLVKDVPQPAGWEIDARFFPAREVAGDFYDVFTMSQNRRLGLVIADVSDKGVGAALFMALFRSLIRAFAQQNYSVNWSGLFDGDTSPTVNRQSAPSIGITALRNAVSLTNDYIINNHEQAAMFATLFFGVLDPMTGALSYINAGHNPPFIIGKSGVKAQLEKTGPALGLMPDVNFAVGQTQLDPGDFFLSYTDGVTEAISAGGDFFSDERLVGLAGQPASSARELLDRIENDVRDFCAGAKQSDDITLLAARRA